MFSHTKKKMVIILILSNFSFISLKSFSANTTKRHEFDPNLIKRIVTPNPKISETFDSTKKQDLIQFPFVPGQMLYGLMKTLDQKQSIKRQMQLQYGLNSYNVSYIKSEPETWAKVGDHLSGVSPNCFLCHSSYINGQFVPGIGNTRVDLKLFLNDLIFKNKAENIKSLSTLTNRIKEIYKKGSEAKSSSFINRSILLYSVFDFMLDPTRQSLAAGHTNPWSFAEYLVSWRDENMDYWTPKPSLEGLTGRGFKSAQVVLDPMPWWQLKYKNYINWDGLMKKSGRVIVQASLSPGRNGNQIRDMDGLFTQIYDEIHKMDPPEYPKLKGLSLDKISRGEQAFNKYCSECHGKYSERGVYYRNPTDFRDPKKGNYSDEIINWSHINTDDTRIKGMNLLYINTVEKTWLGHYADENYQFRTRKVLSDYLNNPKPENPKSVKEVKNFCAQYYGFDCTNVINEELKKKVYGYQIPPLWGVWASAPYFHNGSVPNLRAVLFPNERPAKWKLKDDPKNRNTPYTPYIIDNPGLDVELKLDHEPPSTKIYDTTNLGCSNQGHDIKDWNQIPSKPIPDQIKSDILEYLKTL